LQDDLILTTENLSVGYDEVLISGITLKVLKGEVIAIVGPSGIGKTTLLRTIAKLVKPLSGSIYTEIPKRGGLGYIPQMLGLVRHASVYHNVDLGARAGTRIFTGETSWFARRNDRTLSAIERMGLTEKVNEPVRRLSGGQQRRVATARTLAQKPRLILADEFLSELDEGNISIVLEAVKEYMANNSSAMIIVEHNIKRAAEISDRMLQIKDRKLVPASLQDFDLEAEL
tara:strand:- start:3694 stop:4380 length:687 start_codon:yes stop_codon:yes gene_type:complete